MVISAICCETTKLKEFQYKSGIVSKATAKNFLEYLLKNGIGANLGDSYLFSDDDRVKLAILALQTGIIQ